MTGSESKLKKPWDFRNDRLEWVEKLVLRALNSEVMGCEGRRVGRGMREENAQLRTSTSSSWPVAWEAWG